MIITGNSFIKKILVLLIAVAGLYYAKSFLMPLAIGTVLATLFLPFCQWMEKRRVPRGLASFICMVTLILAVAGIGALLGWQVFELSRDFEQVKLKIMHAGTAVQEYIFAHAGISVERQSQFIGGQQPFVNKIIQATAASLTTIFTYAVLILVYILFLLYYRSHIKNFLLQLVPPAQKVEMGKIIYSVARVSQQYLLGLSKMIACLWIMYGIGFSALGVKNAFFFAFLCGLLEIVPFIGNITGTTLTVLVAAVQGASPLLLIGIVSAYGIIQFIQGWVLEPFIVGSQVRINPLFTIIALVIGDLVWGIPGIFLAIPLIAMFKIVCDHIDALKPFGFLIGETENKNKGYPFPGKLKSWFRKSPK